MAKPKDKERLLKAAKKKKKKKKQVVVYKSGSIRLSSDFSTETFQSKRDWHEIFKVMKNKNLQPRLFTQKD